jgi:predicted ATPase
MLQQFRRDAPATQACIEADIAIAIDQGFLQWVQMDTFLQGWAVAEQGHVAQGIAQMRRGMAAWRAMGADLHRPYFLALLAEAEAAMGQVTEGLRLLAEAFAIVRHNGECLNEAELYRLQGELTLQGMVSVPSPGAARASALEPPPEVEASFRQALAVAQRQHAKSLELRAAMSLARLWQRQGKCTAARALLAPIYSWFTEGFDTADLREAQALLTALENEEVARV